MDLSSLNPAQSRAVMAVEGPILVLAGAGSGKTRVLTHRIASLIETHDIFPSNILAITFTNKAANEMRERIEHLIGPVSQQMWVGTFHAICVRILRRDGDRIGFGNDFVIYDTADQKALLKVCYKELGIDDKRQPLKSTQYKISNAKNDMLTPEGYEKEFGGDFTERDFIKLYKRYQEKIKQNQAMDFDDLLLNTLLLFKEAPDVLAGYQQRFRYIHVDEYQDTNRAQYLLIKALAGKHHNLFVVGDGDQSIYKWRGADIRNIREFELDYPGAQLIKLEQNYRSTQYILDLANSVIKQNPNRKDKVLWTDRGKGQKAKYYKAYDERDEANFVVRQIKRLVREEGYRYKDFAILYRTNAQSRAFEDLLIVEQVAYKVVGGLKFYERKEIKDILAYLKLVVNPQDDVSFQRVINEPKRSIGGKSIEKLQMYAQERGLSLLEACGEPEAMALLSGKARQGAEAFYQIIGALKAKVDTAFVSTIFDDLMAQTGLITLYEQERTIEADARIDNIYEFKSVIDAFEQRNEAPNLRDFLAETTLRSDQDSIEDTDDSILLMTIHASKGLEFPVVFLVGLEENLFPSFRAADDPEALEEERRLCYVGITRAENMLVISHAMNRTQYGRYEARFPSVFLTEMDTACIDGIDPAGVEMPHKEKPKQSYFSIGKSSVAASKLVPKPMKPTEAAQTGSVENIDFVYKPGAKVMHKVFGSGMIISVNGSILTIAFDNKGIKKLDADIAPLKPIG
ncbi:UvrD-helicase domain-containing protein [Fusibacter paucivorans]|uniref:DNA 3'-5' helicase n=1 Tax=Fusibacter paucivorans TaxID=76009 RepID=A0ABS5PKC6_9FIRM|nr:UvrD-helicase domain-containing protein [Fusibacter paucivorans]MBS7525608.1 UvrD-helicase domain-containing protein [Fusibacter paucivorans]